MARIMCDSQSRPLLSAKWIRSIMQSVARRKKASGRRSVRKRAGKSKAFIVYGVVLSAIGLVFVRCCICPQGILSQLSV